MAISDDLFHDLPTDVYQASFILLTRVNSKIIGDKPHMGSYSEACGVLEAFYEAYDLKIPAPVTPRNTSGYESQTDAIERERGRWKLQYEAFQIEIVERHREISKKIAKDALAGTIAKAFGYAVLTGEEKGLIHKHIEKIRAIIEGSGLEDRKKNALFERLGELATEVNRNGTRTDRFFAFAGELGLCLSQFTQNARPAIDETKEMLKIVTRARARQDNIKLPAGDEVLMLPEPEEE